MGSWLLYCSLLLLLLLAAGPIHAQDEIFNRIYTMVDTNDPCLLFLNSSGPSGCAAYDVRITGTLLKAFQQSEFDSITSKPLKLPTGKIALLLSSQLLNKNNLNKLTNMYSVAGVLVADQGAASTGYSADTISPNDQSATAHAWNPVGDGLRFEYFNFPMFRLTSESQITSLKNMAQYNMDRSSSYMPYTVQLTYPPFAQGTSKSCLNDQTCWPVGDFSVWTSIGAPVQSDKQSVILTSSLDSVSMFPYMGAPGAESSGSSASVLIGVVSALAAVPQSVLSQLPKQILFMIFNAESFSYTGSRRFIYDIDTFNCSKLTKGNANACSQPSRLSLDFKKINLDNVSAHFSVSQVGLNSSKAIFLHSNFGDTASNLISLIQNVSSTASSIPFTVSTVSGSVPYSSAVPFISRLPSVPTVVLTDFDTEFANKNYHTAQDTMDHIDQNQLCKVATIVARSVFLSAAEGGENTIDFQTIANSLEPNCTLISSVLSCLSSGNSCDLASQLNLPFSSISTSYQGLYLPANSYQDVQAGARLVFEVLNNLTAIANMNLTCTSDEACVSANSTCIQGRCASSLTRIHDAYDLGIEVDYQEQFYSVVNSSYPNWAVSMYNTVELRAFWKEADATGAGMLVAGAVMLIGSYFMCKKLQVYFTSKFKF